MHPDTMKRTETLVYGPIGWIRCVCCEKLQRDFGARTFVLIAPVQYVLHQAEVPDLSVSGDKFDLAEDDPHDPTTTSEPEAPMQSLNQLPEVTDLVDARSA